MIRLLLPLLAVFLSSSTFYDASNEFSLKNNPNNVWEYGYSDGTSLAPDQFQLDKFYETAGVIGFWHPEANKGPGPGYYPYVAWNPTRQSQYGSSNGWAVRPGEIAMEGSNTGQYSIVRFTAPQAGRYAISARFEGVHFGLSTTDVHVLHNGESLFAADIDGYGGDPAFHKIEGSSPTADYLGEVDLKQHDTVTFAVGYGKNKTHFGDTTGLFARVEPVKNSTQ